MPFTMIVGLIGHPVAHSKSPHMQQAALAHVGLKDWRYELWDTPPEALPARMCEVGQRDDVAGCNVTIPHKQAVMPYLDAVSQHAQAIGAVNTIFKRGPSLVGDNTDWMGFLADLHFHRVAVDQGTRALVLGAGGSARAVVYALALRGAHVLIYNRTPERARDLLDALASAPGLSRIADNCAVVASLADLACQRATLIVNCTSVGMWPDVDASPWPDAVPFPNQAVLYDLVYKPRTTKLMQQADAFGARAIGGLGMLAEQGAAAFERWTGVSAARVSAIMREALNHA
jgi:shikimate dehydrogenase